MSPAPRAQAAAAPVAPAFPFMVPWSWMDAGSTAMQSWLELQRTLWQPWFDLQSEWLRSCQEAGWPMAGLPARGTEQLA